MKSISFLYLFVVIFAEPGYGQNTFLDNKNNTCSTSSRSSDIGIIVTGGFMNFKSVELLDANGTQICELPSLPKARFWHTQDGFLSCGGGETDTSRTCHKFDSGVWTEQSMKYKRYQQSSWLMPTGEVLLMGGESFYNSTVKINNSSRVEIIMGADDKDDFGTEVLNNSGSEDAFDLAFGVSSACSIQLGVKVIVTGGSFKAPNQSTVVTDRVIAYNENSLLEILPKLNIARLDHGCGHYISRDGIEVYLVSGGRSISYNSYGYFDDFVELLNTETYVDGASSWTLLPSSSNLPSFRVGSASVSLDNKIFITGGISDFVNGIGTDEILQWNICTMEWNLVNHMLHVRVYHGISSVLLESVREYCLS